LSVRGEFEQGFSRVTITDEGDGFDPAEVDDPTHPRNIDKPHGRGLILIRAFMDEVTFNDVGNEVQLTKRTPQR
jgi:anti-sigma regulatory factor (Ser/Thr protein kinase)